LYFWGGFQLFEAQPNQKPRSVTLEIKDAVELKVHTPEEVMSVPGRGAMGLVRGAVVGGLSAGPVGALAGAALGAASGAAAAKIGNKIMKGPQRFFLRFKDGRKLEAEFAVDDVQAGTFDRMKTLFEERANGKSEVLEESEAEPASPFGSPLTTLIEGTLRARLETLENLRRDGLVSEDEYAAKRAEIISQL
jgi:hypothetical protein